MGLLMLEPTEIAQWQSLVTAAGKDCNIKLSENVESYLVFMLMRYVNKPHTFSQALATGYLEAQYETGSVRQAQLQYTADRCVLVAGLLPGLAKKRLVTVNYYVDLAYSAYGQISTLLHNGAYQKMYKELTYHVVDMVVLLSSTRRTDGMEKAVHRAYAELLKNHPKVQ